MLTLLKELLNRLLNAPADLLKVERACREMERESHCREMALKAYRSPRVCAYWKYQAELARARYWGIIYADDN